jgi:antitoxin PrlF
MKSRLSERGQITIPKKIRDRLGLRAGQEIDFETRNGILIGRKALQQNDPVSDVTGILEGIDVDQALKESRGPKWSKRLDANGS